eukprot:TRINITY_DN287_c0_g4_i1.p1 TRINITY_DN287_c0_g4~~TRINITY_DN287_c0_g4_i1.p1  ORF type:complete len:752 (+),score=166.70 TRINITY_DN287_c0_g4_i1:194-2257(+)
MKTFLLRDGTSFQEHLQRQKEEYDYYSVVILLLLEKGVELSFAGKSRALAAAWARKDWELSDIFLSKEEWFSMPEVLKALKILDAPRRRKALEKRIERLQKQGTAKPKTIGQLRSKINDIRAETPDTQETALNHSLIKRVKQWLYSIPSPKLAFYAIQMPKELWQELADIVHPKSSKMQLGWFFDVMFGKEAPSDSVVKVVQNLSLDNIENRFKQTPIPYSFLRRQITGEIPLPVKVGIAKYEKVNTLIWYHEELACPEVDSIISERLLAGDVPTFTYGKLMERLLYFKMNKIQFYDRLISLAETRLHAIKLPLEPPVVVCGDASYSMDIAIRTATVIGSVLTVVSHADLRFFNVHSIPPHIVPRTIPQVMDVALNTKAIGLTAPGCVLWEYYKKREIVRFFIMVTDEIENEPFEIPEFEESQETQEDTTDQNQKAESKKSKLSVSSGERYFFAQLFYKYYTEVYPAKLIFVSFLENPQEKGRMVLSLENLGFSPIQFRLDAKRPDLTKLDGILGILSSEQKVFTQTVDEYREHFKTHRSLEKLKDLISPPLIFSLPITTTSSTSSTPSTTSVTSSTSSNSAPTELELPDTTTSSSLESKPSILDRETKSEESKTQTQTQTQTQTETGKEPTSSTTYETCVICLAVPPDTALLECGHFGYCETCAKGLKECSICRKPVVRSIRIYKP